MFQVIVLTPLGAGDPALAIAASRAGHIGILDAEMPLGAQRLDAALEQLSLGAKAGFGLKLGLPDADDLTRIAAYADRGLNRVVLDGAQVLKSPGIIAKIAKLGPEVWLEVLDWDPALAKLKGVTALIAKGHESGGRIGEQTSFILLQKLVAGQSLPVFVRGGLGLHSSAAARAGGAAGIVLDDQLLMVRESGLAEFARTHLSRFTGIETGMIEIDETRRWRLFEQPGLRKIQALRSKFAGGKVAAADAAAEVEAAIGWDIAAGQLAPIGQAAAFAKQLADQFGSVGRVARAYLAQSAKQVALAAELDVLAPGTGVAAGHGTEYPIVQGPMTRVSDTAAFAQSVAEGGALPMVALALMRPDKVETLLSDTQDRLKGKHWGVGLLGFAPSSLIKAQVEVALRYGPSFALIAGGRPDQAREMEAEGIPSYLHVPSPRLLTMFLEQGANRFVFEGRECGGHVGPLSSFVLWDHMVSTLLEHVTDRKQAEGMHVLFAGGIHDARSAAMVAAIAAPLVERGIKIGVLVGTAYLFTAEAVAGEGIVEAFQKVALDCEKTVTLETGPGHASRAAMSPFATEFLDRRRELEARNESADDIRDALEDLTLGRLRVASKATERKGDDLLKVPLARQKKTGMYMIGQVATLRDSVTTIKDLHHDISVAPRAVLAAAAQAADDAKAPATAKARPADIAIIGVAAMLPNAGTTQDYWENILDQVSAIREIPRERWDYRLYFDEDRDAEDKIYAKWGGFLNDMMFDPFKFGIPPKAITAIDPLQLMALEVGRRCLADAGYEGTDLNREKASIILGASGGAGDVGAQYAVRSELTRFTGGVDPLAAELLPHWTEDSFAGILLNVASGRAANRFDFGGVNYTVDAACASSLAAVYQAVLELETGRSDLVVAGGVDTVQGPFGYLCFSKTQALSPRGKSHALQEDADGIVISEGIAMVALKRLADAERDGDRIHAVIKGVGGSSDGRAKSMTAPHPDGQIRALNRAYEMAGYSPATVGLFEAHGTGTVAGDTAELETVTRLLTAAGAADHSSAIGSVKTMIGHTKASAGISGMIKATMAVKTGILPPHGREAAPNKRLQDDDTRLYVVDQPMPWIRDGDTPRRAGISAFGFGGTNFHLTLEEYDGARAMPALREAPRQRWSHELLIWRAPDKAALAARMRDLASKLAAAPDVVLRDLAFTLAEQAPATGATATLVVSGKDDLSARIGALAAHLEDDAKPLPPGAAFSAAPLLAEDGKLALIFPGQGTQYPHMLREILALFPEAQDVLARADVVLADQMAAKDAPAGKLSRVVMPVATYDDARLKQAATRLTRTDFAQPGLGAIEAGLLALLNQFGLRGDMAAGHSYGEFVALHAAGVLSLDDLLRVSEARGRFMVEAAEGGDLGTMAAVMTEREQVQALIAGIPDLCVANHNAPKQSILSGSRAAIETAIARCEAEGVTARPIAVGAAFHSSIVAPARDALADYIGKLDLEPQQFPVYANATGAAYSDDMSELRATLAGQLARPVEFVTEIGAMHDAGARVFLNVGPKSVHSTMVRQILGDRPHRAISMDDESGGLSGLLGALGALLAEGAGLSLSRLWAGRDCQRLNLSSVDALTPPAPAAHLWMLNGGGAHKVGEPPRRVMTVEDFAAIDAEKHKAVPAQPAAAPQNTAAARPAVADQNNRKGKVMDQTYPYDDDSMPSAAEPYATSDRHAVLADFQATMARFLEMQESVMLAYMGNAPAAARPVRRSVSAIPAPRRVAQAPVAKPAPAPAPAPVAAAAAPAPVAPAPAPAAAPAPAPAPAAAAPAPAALNEDGVKDILLGLVEDRTGYPRDMLGLDQAIEADLGIDSIKRVEIVGALLKALPGGAREAAADMGEALNEQKTLGGMIARLWERLETAPGGAAPRPFDQRVAAPVSAPVTDAGAVATPRYLMSGAYEPLPQGARGTLPAGRYLITDDGAGLAPALADKITAAGGTAQVVQAAALRDQAALDATQGADLAGVIHLAPVGAVALGEDATLAAWQAQIEDNEKLAYRLARTHAAQLAEGRILVASGLGGDFGRSASAPGLKATGGGVGLAKSIREEWANCIAKAVDLDPSLPAPENAEHILAELTCPEGRVEVGYPGGKRMIFHTVLAPVGDADLATPDADWVVLATGGARGITAEVLRPLAAAGATLVLWGRSALPLDEPAELAALTTQAELQKHFIQAAKASGAPVTPAAIARLVSAVQRDREMRANIATFTALGGKPVYQSVDVSDPAAVQAGLDALYSDFGRIDGVIHGAGVIEDKLLVDKTPDSWSRVVETKLVSAFALAQGLRADSLKFLTFFASVAGRYGNSGQSDYAAANEMLNRLALQLRARWGDAVKVA
ncbi:SDR family NAD(P)-dependent oxidoreductase, partial [Actibacterium sp.]|uniref:SDR family NAD(P)-dependent oxidoreductase n=1 Tax=Actibacterium sp. TaxID=1872125 RepID=UPI003565B470